MGSGAGEILERRRRSSSVTAMALDFRALALIDDEVQKFVTNKNAPPPKKMVKPKRRASVEQSPCSSPMYSGGADGLPRGSISLSELPQNPMMTSGEVVLPPPLASPMRSVSNQSEGSIPRIGGGRALMEKETL